MEQVNELHCLYEMQNSYVHLTEYNTQSMFVIMSPF